MLGLLGLALVGSDAYGQRFRMGPRTPAVNINPNPLIAPGLSLAQYAYNFGVLNNAYKAIPPQLLGYNPFIAGAKTIVNPNGPPLYPYYPRYPYPRYPTLVVYRVGGGVPYSLAASPYNPYLSGMNVTSASPDSGYSLSTSGGQKQSSGSLPPIPPVPPLPPLPPIPPIP
jgi:hypothetical protein